LLLRDRSMRSLKTARQHWSESWERARQYHRQPKKKLD
jgi:hypothetical protein